MNVAARIPKVHLRKTLPKTAPRKDPTDTEALLALLCIGVSEHRRAQFTRHCHEPSTMTKGTLWTLYQTGRALKKDGEAYHPHRLREIRRLIAVAPQHVRDEVTMDELI